MKHINIVLALVLILIFTGCSSGEGSVNSIRIVLPESPTHVVKNIFGVFERQLIKRCPVKVKTEGRAQLKANNGTPNTKCNKAFEELIEIYHAQNADPVVRPPLPRN